MIKESTICNEKVHVKKQSLLHDSFEIVVLELQLCIVETQLQLILHY